MHVVGCHHSGGVSLTVGVGGRKCSEVCSWAAGRRGEVASSGGHHAACYRLLKPDSLWHWRGQVTWCGQGGGRTLRTGGRDGE